MKRYLAALPIVLASQCAPQECSPPTVNVVEWTVNWDRVAICESGGNWSHGPVRYGDINYSGGLMIGHRWWNAYGGQQFASAPHLASKSQQIIVAERIVDGHGGGYAGADRGWQCVGGPADGGV